MPNMAELSRAASSTMPLTSTRLVGRVAEEGMNFAVSAIKAIPMGTLTRKMPRHDQ